MKLPENKKERFQVLVLIAIGGIAVIYLGVSAGIQPVTRYKKEKRDRAEQLKEEIRKADQKIKHIQADSLRNQEILEQICSEAEMYVLRPTLGGNYFLGAGEMIERIARKADVTIDPPSEAGVSEIPQNSARPTGNVLKSYGVRISMKASFQDLLRFLTELEASNPYLCVSSISVSGQGTADPESHRISMEVQWPIWADDTTPDNLKQQLAESKKAGVRKP